MQNGKADGLHLRAENRLLNGKEGSLPSEAFSPSRFGRLSFQPDLTDAMSSDSPADLLRKSVGFAVCQAWDTLFLEYSRYVSWRSARPDFRLRAVDLRHRRP